MHLNNHKLLALVVSFLFLFPASLLFGQNTQKVSLPQPAPPFAGERLDYEVGWSGMRVGKITIWDHGWTYQRNGQLSHKIETYARTDGPIENIFDRSWKYIGYLTDDHKPWFYEEWEKKGKKWEVDDILSFHFNEGLVRRTKRGELRDTIPISDKTVDPVCAVYQARSLNMKPGSRYETSLVEGKYVYQIHLYVTQGPEWPSDNGNIPTYELTPVIYWNGEQLRNRDIKAWITADERRIPLLLRVDVEVGSVTGQLVGYQPPTGKNTDELQ